MKRTKTILLTITLLLCFSFTADAQRRLPGMSGVYAFGGITNAGLSAWHFGVGYSRYFRNQQQFAYEFNYLRMTYQQEGFRIPLEQYTVGARYFRNFFMDRTRSFFASANVGILLGYETVNRNSRILPNGALITNSDAVLWGATLGVRLSYYYQDHLVVLLGINQRAVGGTTVNNFRTQFYIGLKYVFP